MRRRLPRAKNGPRAEAQKGFPVWPVSICLRLEIIAILSGPLPEETFRRPVVMPFRPAALTPPPTNHTATLVRFFAARCPVRLPGGPRREGRRMGCSVGNKLTGASAAVLTNFANCLIFFGQKNKPGLPRRGRAKAR